MLALFVEACMLVLLIANSLKTRNYTTGWPKGRNFAIVEELSGI